MQRHIEWRLLTLALAGLALAALHTVPASSQQPPDAAWVQVNDDAFGLPSGGSHAAEEGFEVTVFNDQLYLGMEADNSLGARIWRSRSGIVSPTTQADWEEVAADAEGRPFGGHPVQNDHIDSLAVFDGYLYASTANRGNTSSGTLVYRSASGAAGSWTQVISPGFGSLANANFKDMQVFAEQLCGGTYNTTTGAQVWCTADGQTWQQYNRSGFGDPANRVIWSGAVYQDALYFGVENGQEQRGRLFRLTSLITKPGRLAQQDWHEVYRGPVGSSRVDILGAFDGHLYIATGSLGGIAVLRSASGAADTWVRVSIAGMEQDSGDANIGTVVDGAAVYNDALYVAVSNAAGVELWRTTGRQSAEQYVDWQRIGERGFGDANNRHAQLMPFQGALYAWTSNYATGQQVRRAVLPPPWQEVYLPFVRAGGLSERAQMLGE